MIKQEFSQQINAPVEKVFAFLTDFRNNPKFQDGVIEVTQMPDGPIQVGTTFKEVRIFLSEQIETTYEITEFVPNKKIAFKSISGPAPFQSVQTFEPMNGGTKVNVYVEMEGSDFFKLTEDEMDDNVKKEFEQQSAKLRELLEE